jgi:type IV secretion system protein VirD4
MFILKITGLLCLGLLKLTAILGAGITRKAWQLLRWLLRPRSRTFGSAHWAGFLAAWRAGVLGGKGFIVGKRWFRFVRQNLEGYALIFAATRTGKTALLGANLLEYAGSAIVNDPKGELRAVTGRSRLARGKVFALDLNDPANSDCFNPLQWLIRVDTFHEADDAAELADLLVVEDGDGTHWSQKSRDFLQCIILYVIRRYRDTPELMTLAKVRSLVAMGIEGLEPVFDEAMTLGSPTLRDRALSFKGMAASDEARSMISNADKAVAVFAADRPAGMVTRASDFDMMEFNRSVATLFVICDEEKSHVYRGFMRVILGCAVIAMTRAKAESPPPVPTMLMFDETAMLGRMEVLEEAASYLGTYARMVLVYQDLDQLERTSPKARSIIANASVKVAFGVSDLATAKMLADMIGFMTVRSRSDGASKRNQDFLTNQSNNGTSEGQRYLIDPSEILRLDRNRSIIFFNAPVRLQAPLKAYKVRYFEERRWRGQWDRWRQQQQHRPPQPLRLSGPAPS